MIYKTKEELEKIKFYCKSELKIQKIDKFIENLLHENLKYNLIGKSTINNLWTRHVIDSLQLVEIINQINCDNIIDIGSGGGFPSIPIACAMPEKQFILIEKSIVKCNFLNKVKSELMLDNISIENKKIESLGIKLNLIENKLFISRAFKSIAEILNILDNCNILDQSITILLLKGISSKKEINDACNMGFNFDIISYDSKVHKDGQILYLSKIKKTQI